VTAAIQKGRVLLGIACYVVAWKGQPDAHPNIFIPFLRLYNQSTDDYLYTTSQAEADNAARYGYVFETIACNVMDPNSPLPTGASSPQGTVPLLRGFNPQTSEHFYTTQAGIFSQHPEFQREGTSGFVFDPHYGPVPGWDTSTPFYRLSRIGATPPSLIPWWNRELP